MLPDDAPVKDAGDRPPSLHLDILPALRDLERRRQRVAAKARFRHGLIAVLAIMGLIIIAPLAKNPLQLLGMIGAVGVLTLGAMVEVEQKMMRNVVASYKDQVIPRLVESLGGDLTYRKLGRFPRESFVESRLFFHWPEFFHSEDRITGTLGATQIRFAELKAEGRDHLSSKERFTIFEGLFFELDFNKSLSGSVFLYPEGDGVFWNKSSGQWFQDQFKARGPLIKLEDPEFERHFVVYGSDQIEARYVLTPAMMQRIVAFREKAGVPVAMSFIGRKLYIAVYHRGDFLEPDIFSSFIDRQAVTRLLDELRLAVGIVEDLNLNLRLWDPLRPPK